MKLHRGLALFMTFFLIFTATFSSFSVAFAESESGKKFSDVKKTDWYYEYVQMISSIGLIEGVGKDSHNLDVFAPRKPLTVAEMLAVVLRALNEDAKKLPDDTNWYDCVIRKSKELGLVLKGEFTEYNMPITRGEMSRIISRALNKLDKQDNNQLPGNIEIYKDTISDYENIPDNIKQYALECYYLGILTGIDSKGTFMHDGQVTRAEMSAIIVRMLIPEYREINVNDLLHYAVLSDDISEINKLINWGGDPNYIDKYDRSLLEWAIGSGEADTIKALIDAGANVNTCNSLGNSMLHLAVMYSNPDAVELLIKNGADTNIKNSSNITPLEFAASLNKIIVNGKDKNELIIDLLLDKTTSIADFIKYINIRYNEVDTPMGKWTLKHTISENDSSIFAYDYWIQTDWSGCSPYDIKYSIKYDRTEKNKTIEILKDLQSKIANDAFKCFPNKKIMGGYYSGFYKYPNLKVGYESIRFLSWINYNYDLFNASDYYSTYVTGFHWFNLFDDYDFVEGV